MRKRNRDNGNNNAGIGKVVTGLLVGGVVGATVGLLMAPASGEETRRKIKSEAEGVQRKAKAAVSNIEVKTREGVEDARENLETVREGIVERVIRRKKNASS